MRSGEHIKQLQGYYAFVPAPLPPEPPIDVARLFKPLSDATLALGKLDGATRTLPNPDLFVAMYVKQEAVLSSQIEGTQASLTDVLQFESGTGEEAEPGATKDVREVVNYVHAMNYGLERIKGDEFPLSLRLIREIHAELLKEGRGHEKNPGEFRAEQVWIGGEGSSVRTATFVPPPPGDPLIKALGDLETFLYDESFPELIHAGLVHAQFETIHPFLDGNGRVGRLLITFLLCDREVMTRPLLYLSYFLKKHRAEYYDRLQAIRVDGKWEEWLAFFLRGVKEVAEQAALKARQIIDLQEKHQQIISEQGKASGNLHRALTAFFERPIMTSNALADKIGVQYNAANMIMKRLQELGIVQEKTGFRRNKRFAYQPFLDLFEKDTTGALPDDTLEIMRSVERTQS